MFFSFSLLSKNVDAKVLPQAAKIGKPTTTAKTASTSISVSPRLRGDRKALIVYFSNLQNAKSVSYSLTYDTAVQPEGAIGSVNLNGPTNTSVELLFGTCSKNVCRYHTGISNAKLEVSYTAKSGNKYIKRFKIKV